MEGTDPLTHSRILSAVRYALPIAALLTALSPGGLRAAGTFLVVEHPGNLVLYDRYQQSLSPHDRAALGSWIPLRIVEPRSVLGDGITPCMVVEFAGKPLFLLLEADNRIAGEAKAGRLFREENAFPLQDTVDVLRGGRLTFTSPAGGKADHLRTGERFVRIFRSGTRTFIWRQSTPPAYGWVVLPDRDKDWRILQVRQTLEPGVTERVRREVNARVADVNRVLSGLFSYFNNTGTAHREPPRWVIGAGGDALTCTLEGTSEPGAFAESSRELGKALESVVLGSSLRVDVSPGKIVIHSG